MQQSFIKKTTLKASVIAITAALVFGGASVKAEEEGKGALKPQTNWAVTKIDQPSEGVSAYCTLARQYDEGIVFTIGRNQAEEYSLAIDFQNQKLDLDKAYSMTLQPGPGQIRAYEMMPASERAMVVRLGWDESFLKALEKSNSLKAEIGNKKYTFDLAGFSAGHSDLNACMKGLKSDDVKVASNDDNKEAGFSAQKLASATKDATPETVVEAVQEVAEKPKEIVTKAAEKVTQKVKEPVAKLTKAEEQPTVVMADNVPQQLAPQKIAEAKNVGDDTNKKLEAELAKLREENAALMKRTQVTAGQQNAALEAANAELKKASEENVSLQKEIAALKEKMSAADQEKAQKQAAEAAKKEQEMAAKIQSYEEKIAALEAENKKYFEDAKQAMGKIDSAKVEIGTKALEKTRELEKKLEAANADNIRLKTEIEEMRIAQENSLLNSSGTDFNLEKVTQRYNESQREVKRLGAQLEAQRLSHKQEIQKLEQMLFDPAVAEDTQRDRLVELEKKLKAAEEKAKSAAGDEKIKSLNERLIAEQKKAQEAEEKLSSKEAELEQKLSSKEAELEQKETLLKDLRQQIASIEKNKVSNNAQVAEKDAVIATLKEQLGTEQAKANSLGTKVEELNAKIASYEKGSVAVDQRVADKELKIAELSGLLAEEKAKNEQISQKLAQQNSKVESLTASLTEKESGAQGQSQELIQKEAALATAQAELEIEKQKNKKIADKLVSQDLKIAELEAQMKVKEASVSNDTQQLAAVQAQLAGEQAKSQKISAKLIEQDALIQNLQAQLGASNANKAQEGATMAAKLKEIAELKETLTIKDNFLKEIAAESTKKDQEIKALSDQLASRGETTRNFQGDLAQKDAEIAKLRQALAAKESALASQGTKLARLEKQVSQAASAAARQVTSRDLPVPSSMAAAPQAIEPAAQPNRAPSIGESDIQAILQNAGLGAGSIRTERQSNGTNVYRWNTPTLSGVAQVLSAAQGGNVSQFANSYINQQKSRCAGDFASVPGQKGNGFSTYEVACVGGNNSMSSSVIFFEKKGSVGVIAHQTSADDMDVAMDARDKVAAQIGRL